MGGHWSAETCGESLLVSWLTQSTGVALLEDPVPVFWLTAEWRFTPCYNDGLDYIALAWQTMVELNMGLRPKEVQMGLGFPYDWIL